MGLFSPQRRHRPLDGGFFCDSLRRSVSSAGFSFSLVGVKGFSITSSSVKVSVIKSGSDSTNARLAPAPGLAVGRAADDLHGPLAPGADDVQPGQLDLREVLLEGFLRTVPRLQPDAGRHLSPFS